MTNKDKVAPSVTAIITTYNRAMLVGRAINSVLAQTRSVDEVIVIDDGSADKTAEVVRTYAERVRYVIQENRGLAGARNRGIAEARSDWVAFLDDDDEWMPEKIERQFDALRLDGASVLCYSGVRLISESGDSHDAPAPKADALWPGIRLKNRFAPSTILARRDILLANGGFRTGLRCAEDWELSIRLAAKYPVVGVPDALVRFHMQSQSLSRKGEAMLAAELSILDSLLVGLRGPYREIWKLRVLSAIFYRAAISARESTGSGFRYLVLSLLYWPSPLLWPDRYRTLVVELRDQVSGERSVR